MHARRSVLAHPQLMVRGRDQDFRFGARHYLRLMLLPRHQKRIAARTNSFLHAFYALKLPRWQ